MKIIDTNTWKRKQQYKHFKDFHDPYFAVTIPFEVDIAYENAKKNGISFFAKYLHDCMRAINEIENLKLRISQGKVVQFDVIHASTTIMRNDNTYALSYVLFDSDIQVFISNLEMEKKRVITTGDFYPLVNSLDCIHCSALPWFNFVGHKEASSGFPDSVPKLAFGKTYKENDKLKMNVAIHVNHALADGADIGLFAKAFQDHLNS